MPIHPLSLDALLHEAAACETGLEVRTNSPLKLRSMLTRRRQYLVRTLGIAEIAFVTIRTPPRDAQTSLWLVREPHKVPTILRNFYAPPKK